MRLKQRPEDFSVKEAYRFDDVPDGRYRVYLMDKQKLSTFEAVERVRTRHRLPSAAFSFCGLKDKQGRTEQLLAVDGRDVAFQEPDLRLKPLGRSATPLSAKNLTANRFAVTVRELTHSDLARLAPSVAEVQRVGLVNYFDSQRFGGVKHGQGFIAKDLIKGQIEHALHNYLAKPSALDKTDDAKVKAFWAEHWGHWTHRCPWTKAMGKYRKILHHLQEHPEDYAGAFLQIDPKYRAMILFEYQSYLWNEGVKELLRQLIGEASLISLAYQAGRLLFHQDAPAPVLRELRERTFPLLSADSKFTDPVTRKAAMAALDRERVTLPELRLPKLPGLFFKHEERPVLVIPGKLVVSEARRDEMNRGFLKVNIAFTLPPGAYATLLVKRLFWFGVLEEEAKTAGTVHPTAVRSLEGAFGPGGARVAAGEQPERAPRPPAPKKLGFREAAKLKKTARAEARAKSKLAASPEGKAAAAAAGPRTLTPKAQAKARARARKALPRTKQ